MGQVIDSQSIQNTPLNGRLSVMGLIALSPGVQGVGAQDQLAVRGLTYAVGTGSRNAYGGLGSTLDGVVNKEVTLQRSEPEIPSLDALADAARGRSQADWLVDLGPGAGRHGLIG